jgi:large subunit ribosomal protein L4
MYRAGMASILSQLAREDRLAIVDSISVDAPKTKLFAQKIKGMGYDSVLVVIDGIDENIFLASRNLPNVLVVEVNEADPVSLIRFPKVLMTKSALAKFEEILG